MIHALVLGGCKASNSRLSVESQHVSVEGLANKSREYK
jgi:hypothetical protein